MTGIAGLVPAAEHKPLLGGQVAEQGVGKFMAGAVDALKLRAKFVEMCLKGVQLRERFGDGDISRGMHHLRSLEFLLGGG